jgi:hypothetical protein
MFLFTFINIIVFSFFMFVYWSCRKNFVKLVIYFEDLNYELVEEQPQIEVN